MKRQAVPNLVAALVLLTALGCTKETPYKAEYKEQVFTKSAIDTESDYLYVASYQNVSRSSELARPYWQGQEKLVKFRFTEKTLQVVQQDEDARFNGNPLNTKIVMEIPVEHLEFRCAKDAHGECTNREEQNSELPWASKSQFKPNFEAIQVVELNLLPVELDRLFGGDCYTPAGAKFSGIEMKKDSLDFQIERTFKVNIACLTSLETLSDATVSVMYHYSMHKLSSVTSAGYKAISYPGKDEKTFGFFTTERTPLDVDNRPVEGTKTVLMNRWNPNRGEVDYYLSDEFAKPENKSLRDSTYLAFERLNNGLIASGAALRLKLHDPDGRKPGDLRNSMIVMVEDPIASGLLGYGPSVTNPLTGEIVSAKTIMYPGIMKQMVRRTYEEIREDRKNLSIDAKAAVKMEIKTEALLSPTTSLVSKARMVAQGNPPRKLPDFKNLDLKKVERSLRVYTDRVTDSSAPQERFDLLSKHCAYSSDFVDFEGAVLENLSEVFGGGELEPWDSLSAEKKKALVDRIVPVVWSSTLIHEVGHNLGLRHNFQGSEDKANFYTRAELDAMGVKREIPYSSVMEYAYSDVNSLPTLGKYDIAALRFAYVRKVQTASGEIVPVEGTLEQTLKLATAKGADLKLKDFGYCTDEHVGANAGCKRFDQGTNLSEIATHFIEKMYKGAYRRANFRNGLKSFSLLNDAAYASRINSVFSSLRLMFETYERIKNDFGIADDNPAWEQVEFLKDMRNAVEIAASFYIEVLKTPDATCLVSPAGDLTKILGALPLTALSNSAISCFDKENVQLKEGYVISGQGGKHFRSKKDPKSTNAYVDQIDVRGIWADKALALKYLVARRIGISSFDRYSDSLISYPGVRAAVIQTIGSILSDNMKAPVEFENIEGKKSVINLAYDFSSTHVIPELFDSSLAKKLNLNENSETMFAEQIFRTIVTEIPSQTHEAESREFLETFQVYRNLPQDGRPLDLYEIADVGTRRYFALKENVFAANAIKNLKVTRVLSKIDETKFAAIVEAVNAGKSEAPADASPDEKAAYGMSIETLESFGQGLVKSEEYYTQLLGLMPTAR